MIRHTKEFLLAACAVGAAFGAGCNRDQIATYSIPKETNRPPSTAVSTDAQSSQSARQIRWASLPQGWKEGQPGSMRVASFEIEGENGQKADVTVTPLLSATDIEGSSLNMWRGEVGLPVVEPKSSLSAEAIMAGGQAGRLYDFAGTSGGVKTRIVGAVLATGGATWFFKMKGPDALVATQKPAFVDFLKSVSFVETSSSPTLTSNPSPGGGASNAGSHPLPKWDAPKHWQALPARSMTLAVFTVPTESEKTEVTVSSLGGDAGGLLANVNRWRGQIDLGPITANELPKPVTVDAGGTAAAIVDLQNDSNGKRTVAAIIPHHGQSWFFKLSGPSAVVEKEKAGFIKFVQSVRFH